MRWAKKANTQDRKRRWGNLEKGWELGRRGYFGHRSCQEFMTGIRDLSWIWDVDPWLLRLFGGLWYSGWGFYGSERWLPMTPKTRDTRYKIQWLDRPINDFSFVRVRTAARDLRLGRQNGQGRQGKEVYTWYGYIVMLHPARPLDLAVHSRMRSWRPSQTE